MVKQRQIAHRIEKKLRVEDCSEIAVETINRNLTIPINGPLTQKTIIRSLVGMSANKLSVHSINKVVEKIPCETSFGYHLSKIDLDSLQKVQSKILTYTKDQILVSGKSYQFAIDPTFRRKGFKNIIFHREPQAKRRFSPTRASYCQSGIP